MRQGAPADARPFRAKGNFAVQNADVVGDVVADVPRSGGGGFQPELLNAQATDLRLRALVLGSLRWRLRGSSCPAPILTTSAGDVDRLGLDCGRHAALITIGAIPGASPPEADLHIFERFGTGLCEAAVDSPPACGPRPSPCSFNWWVFPGAITAVTEALLEKKRRAWQRRQWV
jgi:hypothetical protein